MTEKNSSKIFNKVYVGSLAILLLLVAGGIFIPGPFQDFTSNLTGEITTKFGWFYLLLVTAILFFLFYLTI